MDFTLDLDSSPTPATAAAPEPSTPAPAAPASGGMDIDLSTMRFDLGDSSPPVAAPTTGEAPPPVIAGADAAGAAGNGQEMATKLDLAGAYQDIGDRDGARELLEEVLKGGNAEQQAKARELLAALA
jgi:pilus assembly protein FimV